MHQINAKKHLQLYSSCLLTKGFTQSLIVDSQRKSFELIPNELYTILNTRSKKENYESIINSFPKDDQKTIKAYISYLLKKEYIFFCDKQEIGLFPAIDLDWFYPGDISNAIIDFDNEPTSLKSYFKFIEELTKYGCSAVQIRCYKSFSLIKLKEILHHLITNNIFRCEIFLKFDHQNTLEDYANFLENNPSLSTLYLHSYIKDCEIKLRTDQSFFAIEQKIESETCCGNISMHYLNLNLHHFTESQKFNTCLNKKISVDKNGYIKKCPSMNESLGHINTFKMNEIINSANYSKVDTLSKDKIKTCNICEFRHVCTDCRVYTINNDPLEKPSKCNYDPYTGKYN